MQQYARLHAIGFGVAMGLLWSICVMIMALIAMTGDWGAEFVRWLGSLYIGYDASISGAFVGLAWGFVDGFVCGAILAWLYNFITGIILKVCD